MRKFSDFAEEENLIDGDKISIDSILNQEVTVLAHRLKKSKYEKGSGKCLTIQIEHEERRKVVFTGSEVLINQCERYRGEMPFVARIVKINKYYSFS